MLFEQSRGKSTPSAVTGIEGHGVHGKHTQVPARRNTRHCKFKNCGKKLSAYNQDFYCFSHQIAGQAIEDAKKNARKRKIVDKNTKRSNDIKNEKLRKEKNARS